MNAERYVVLMVTRLVRVRIRTRMPIRHIGPRSNIHPRPVRSIFQAFQMQVKLKRKFGREKSIEAHQARFQ
jgi:hypothetical protein